MNKRRLSWLCFVVAAVLGACGATGQTAPPAGPKARTESQAIPGTDTNRPGTEPAYGIQAAQKNNANLPQLEDGPEKKERNPRAYSNWQLQQKYPHIVAMRGSLRNKRIALTFDDGPDSRFTPQVLNVLKKHNVKGTFFLMGSRAAALPEVTRRIVREGHVVGNHTYWHPNLAKETVSRMSWEARETDRVLQRLVGYNPRMFRPPYGNLTEAQLRTLGKMGYSVIGWSVDSEDWRQVPVNKVIQNVRKDLGPGAIILMHSGGYWTQDLSNMVKALDQIIPALKREGWQFVTVPELLNISKSK